MGKSVQLNGGNQLFGTRHRSLVKYNCGQHVGEPLTKSGF